MKKVLTLLTLIAFTGSVMAATGLTSFTDKINSGLNKLEQKEQEINTKIDTAQAKRAAQKAEAKKKQEEQKKAVEAKKKEIQQSADTSKKAVEEEVSFWKRLFGKN